MHPKMSSPGRSRERVILRLAERAEGPLKCKLRFRNREKTQIAFARALAVCAARDDTRFPSKQLSGNGRLNNMVSVSSKEENGLVVC